MNIAVQKPRWGVNYAPGYSGFVITKGSAVSAGIRWFEDQWQALAQIPVPSHSLIIAGENVTIEATGDGVVHGTISGYLEDPDCTLLVRRPAYYSEDMGQRIVAEARKHLGDNYGTALIVGMAITNSVAGKVFDSLIGGYFSRFVNRVFDNKRAEICSELVSLAMRVQPELQAFGILGRPANCATPLLLFEDRYIYEPPDYAVELVK